MRKIALVAMLATLLGVSIFALKQIPEAEREPKHSVGSITVIGDSLVFGSTEELVSEAEKIGMNVTPKGYIGAYTGQGETAIREAVANNSDVVVVALGTNNGHFLVGKSYNEQYSGLEALSKQQWELLEILKNTRCVVWVGVQDDTVAVSLNTIGAQINSVLRRNTENYPNAKFLDWASLQHKHPEYRHADNLHFTPEGELGYAQAILQAINEFC